MHFARVYYSRRGSLTRTEAGDLIFARGRPLLVLSWHTKDGRRAPKDCVELDPALLQSASANGTIYRYEGSIAL